VLYRGELPRGEIGGIIGSANRQTRRMSSILQERSALTSQSPLAVSATLASGWMQGLFPEKAPRLKRISAGCER
jgi:hypothetical protein